MKPKLRIKQVKSPIGQPRTMETTLHGLGLRRMHQVVTVDNTPSFRGAIKKVMHLVRVEEVDA